MVIGTFTKLNLSKKPSIFDQANVNSYTYRFRLNGNRNDEGGDSHIVTDSVIWNI